MFNVGDRIIMNELADDEYSCTKTGSTGVVLECNETDVYVQFDHLTGFSDPDALFWVAVQGCDLLITLSQEERIINKIKQMEGRWIAFQLRKGTCHV